jgi:hypothetical protein|tara:strand:+ start:2902 stop:3723 length:822 start_codon:yes stop_codon:yes gene_type:complete
MNAFLFYVDDWISSAHVEMMDAAEERGYLRLLLRCAKEEDCGIPHDAAQLSIMSMLGAQWWKQTADKSRRIGEMTSGDKLLKCFESRGGRLYNLRLLKEFENQKRIREERRIAGLKGGRPKANDNQLVSNSLANENQMGKQNESKEKQAQALSPALPEGKDKTPKAPLPKKRQRDPDESRGQRFTGPATLAECPAEWAALCKGLGWPFGRACIEYQNFVDYWSSVPGAKGRKLDWLATWRVRCRDQNKKDPAKPAYEPLPPVKFWVDDLLDPK